MGDYDEDGEYNPQLASPVPLDYIEPEVTPWEIEEGQGQSTDQVSQMYRRIKALEAELKKREVMVWVPVAVLDALTADGHRYSKRPCATCRPISQAMGKPFGCDARRAAHQEPSTLTP